MDELGFPHKLIALAKLSSEEQIVSVRVQTVILDLSPKMLSSSMGRPRSPFY